MTPFSPLPDSEWSSPYSGEPPETLRSFVDEVVGLVEGVPVTLPKQDSTPIPDRPRVISIFGSRGTGKSTVLQFVATALRANDDHLVLPVIDPEAFAPGDSLAGWVFAHLESSLTTNERQHELGPGNQRSLDQLLEDLRRAQAVRSGGYLPGLEQRGLHFDDFARDAVKIPAHGVRTAQRIESLVQSLAEARAKPNFKLIVAIDDADLFPEWLPSIVEDAQMLGASPRVTIVFAAHRPTLARSLEIAYLSRHGEGVATALRHGLIAPKEIRELVYRRLVKHFPRSLRIVLPTLTPEQRVRFRPLGSSDQQDLLEVLSGFPISRGGAQGSFADLFTIRSTSGKSLVVSPYARALSNNARDIRQLYEALVNHRRGRSPEDQAPEALAVILRHGLDGLEPDLPREAAGSLRLEEGERGRAIAQFDFRGIVFGKRVGRQTVVFAREHLSPDDEWPMAPRVVLRHIVDHHSELQPAGPPDPNGSSSDRDTAEPDVERPVGGEALPDQYSHLAFLAWEAAQVGDLLGPSGHMRRLTLPGGRNWSGHVTGSGRSEDWRYWLVPDWEEFSDYFAYQEGWGHVIKLVDEYGIPSLELLEWALFCHLDLIVTVQEQRAVPATLVDLNVDDLRTIVERDHWVEQRSQLQSRIGARLAKTLVEARTGETLRDADFARWFIKLLPLAATPLLTSREMSSWLVDLWRSEVSEEERAECSEILADFARQHIASDLADGDIALLKAVEPGDQDDPTRATALESVRNEIRRRAEQQRQGLIKTLQEQGVDPELIEGLRRRGATRDVVVGLLQAGLQPANITAVAEAFPQMSFDPEAGTTPRKDPPLG